MATADRTHSPEAELLLCCARLELDDAQRERIVHLVGRGPDWPWLLRMAEWHGLRPLLYRHLNALARAAVPKPAFIELWSGHEINARRNRAMAQELTRIVAALEGRGIAAIPWKGPALAEFLYADVALREFGDLDILVRPAQLLAAKAILESLGYVSHYSLTPAAEAAFLRSAMQYHVVMRHPANKTVVELHWKTDLDHPIERAADDLWWDGLGRIPLGISEIRCFSTEELLLVLCLHGTKHFWTSLGWLVDVSELLRQHPALDWEWIGARARELACERRLAIGLTLSRRLLGAPLPTAALHAGADSRRVAVLANEMADALFQPRDRGPFALLLLNLRLYERFRQRLAFCVHVVLAPSLVEWTRWPLPRPLFFLYFPLRAARLACKHFPLLRVGTGKPQLSPRLEDHDRDGIGQVEAAVAGPHRET